ncbi:alpha/beta hydrolase [Sphingomonas sp. HT-1]|uniref:alpha/beta hydrolase n=1 Tax=unclassified Sphingomonas TaxID=196159 RepID=UPI00030D8954|nr:MULTISPECIES: alpha/beta hydrolase [unclassified Sphingomonas]KTF70161.1 alpha/beta hydrolase [Sphingomonas sp. WG]
MQRILLEMGVAPAAAPVDSDLILARVDPELREGARQILAHPLPAPLTSAAVQAMRAAAPPPAAPLPAPEIVHHPLPGAGGRPASSIAVIGARPGTALRPAVLHIHGGGFVVGRAQDTYAASQRMADALDCVVVEAEYRLAPETSFPGPLEDCHAALVWLHANALRLGVDPRRIAVMGESAGGGLAAMLAIAARDRRSVPLCCQILIYPMLDDRTGSTRAVPPFIGTIGWNAPSNADGWSAFLGVPAGSAQVPAGAVPARTTSLAGLPPTFIGVGAIDLFVDEDIAYAQRLIAAGVPTNLRVVPGAYHGFDFIAPRSQASIAFTAAWQHMLRTAFAV